MQLNAEIVRKVISKNMDRSLREYNENVFGKKGENKGYVEKMHNKCRSNIKNVKSKASATAIIFTVPVN